MWNHASEMVDMLAKPATGRKRLAPKEPSMSQIVAAVAAVRSGRRRFACRSHRACSRSLPAHARGDEPVYDRGGGLRRPAELGVGAVLRRRWLLPRGA